MSAKQTSLTSFFLKRPSNGATLTVEKTNECKSIGENSDDDGTGVDVRNAKRQRLQIIDSSDDDEIVEETVSHSVRKKTSRDELALTSTPKSKTLKKGKISKKSKSNTPVANAFKLHITPTVSGGISERSISFLSSFCADESAEISHVDLDTSNSQNFKHLHFDFLRLDKIRDENKMKPSEAEYDPKTLFVPDDFLKSQTPGLKQWWEIKRKHFDTILLFKVGKFYELYHMDAVVAVKELNLSFMKGDYAHCGFPEIAFARFADQLVERGYKVARVEQTETPDMMEERLSKSKTPRTGPKEKVVRRELCRIITPGTKTYGFLDGDTDSADGKYLCALCEETDSLLKCNIGACFVDTSVGKVFISQFEDDAQFSQLHTLFAEYPPVQILFSRGKLSQRLDSLLKSHYTAVIKESLTPKSQFWTALSTLKALASSNYFNSDSDGLSDNQHASLFSVPVLKDFLCDSDPLGLKPRKNGELAISSLGALIWYLKECLIDNDVLSLKNFCKYTPERIDRQKANEILNKKEILTKTMILDGITLKNLEILQNCTTNGAEGTLLSVLDTCSTSFGKRLLRHWLCNPTCSIGVIKARQLAVEDLAKIPEFVAEASKTMKQMPDLERLLQKIHTMGLKSRRDDHPDSRAILYHMDVYNKRKVNDFLSALVGFKAASKIVDSFRSYEKDISSALLKRCLCVDDNENFPKMDDILRHFDEAFDYDQAKKNGVIVPLSKGIDEDYDLAMKNIQEAEENLQKYLRSMRTRYQNGTISYIDSGRNRYQLEVPDSVAKKLSDEFEFESQRKGFKRYMTPELSALRDALLKFESDKVVALKDIMRRIFANFSDHIHVWRKAIECFSLLDVLMAFFRYGQKISVCKCFPSVIPANSNVDPFIEIRDGVHPCLSQITLPMGNFISNDTLIGCGQNNNSNASVLLITGPNMGGKSTLMRQVSLIVILAQIGCYVPAESCLLTPVDRIFTRLGASDRIAAGQSTFFVELSETSAILKHATMHSLVILDELGRGTSTHDGTAIASAVLKELAINIKCRTMFSTHYHTLVDEFSDHQNISLCHMACVVENENNADPTEETITFLYKLASGSCPKSHGFHAAKLAGVPLQVIRRAWDASKMIKSGFSFTKLRSLAFDGVDSLPDETLIEKLVDAMKIC